MRHSYYLGEHLTARIKLCFNTSPIQCSYFGKCNQYFPVAIEEIILLNLFIQTQCFRTQCQLTFKFMKIKQINVCWNMVIRIFLVTTNEFGRADTAPNPGV